MKKFFLTIVFLAVGLLTTQAQGVSAKSENSKANIVNDKTLNADDEATITVTQLGNEITVDISTGDGYVEIYNSNNQLVWSGSMTSGETINITGWPVGGYNAKCDPRHGKYMAYCNFWLTPY